MIRKIVFVILFLMLGMMNPVFAASEMEIFSDANFLNPTTKFAPNQTIYVRIESNDPGEKERIVKLKDNQYRDISTFQLSREGFNPYIYKVSFAAPATSSFYSIEATIASEGSANKLVKTIQVGSSTNVDTRINVKTEVKGTQSRTPTLTPTPITTSTSSPTPTIESQIPQPEIATPSATITSGFWQKLVQFFQNIFRFIFGR